MKKGIIILTVLFPFATYAANACVNKDRIEVVLYWLSTTLIISSLISLIVFSLALSFKKYSDNKRFKLYKKISIIILPLSILIFLFAIALSKILLACTQF
jgi:hypothetical protein